MKVESIDMHGVNFPKTQTGLLKMQTIVDAAESLFSKHNFFKVSVSDICKEAKTAVGTFYIYFDSKIDIYRYLMDRYRNELRRVLSASISQCKTRHDAEREGIKAFIRYAVSNPNVYNIIWGSLAVESNLFKDYYVSFAESYATMLDRSKKELSVDNVLTTAYALMGITNFVGLQAIFEDMDDKQIEKVIDKTVMHILENGMFDKTE